MKQSYFPNQSPELLALEKRLRSIAASLPEAEQLELYAIVSACVPSFEPTTFVANDETVVASQDGGELVFPRPIPLVKLALVAFGYREWLKRKYCMPGFVEVEPGDVVVDCGAYVGGFSLSAAGTAGFVHAFEPDARNAACARRNLAGLDNVRIVECGLYDRTDEMILNISSNSVEHSLLEPDDHVIVERRRIRVVSLADYARKNGITGFDFVKIEAEGVELEVFAGLGDIRPRKLAIDVSPERNGKSPADEFRSLLQSRSYEVRQRGQVMFACRNDGAR